MYDEQGRDTGGYGEARATSAANTLPERLRRLFSPTDEFSIRKFEDNRQFTALVLGCLSLFLPLLWAWDYVTDPIGARDTLGLRALYFLIFPLALAFWSGKAPRRFLENAMPVGLLAGEAVFVEILNRLHDGIIMGLAGYMYSMFIAILAGQGVPLRTAIGYMLAAAALPQIAAYFSLAPGFSQAHYAILIWPAAGLTMLAQTALAIEYLKRYEVEEQLKRLLDTDPLSGVGNRRYFSRLLEQEIKRAQRVGNALSLLLLDVDQFKKINDTYGHPVGDRAIRQMAELCRKSVRQIDLVARIGGEEFAILLLDTGIEPAGEVAERMRARIESARLDIPGHEPVAFTTSIGAAQLRPDDVDGLDLFSRADAALYEAKSGGRNRVVLNCPPPPPDSGDRTA